MPELRTDWLTGRTVIVAEERARRPNEFGEVIAASPRDTGPSATFICPFCPGQEHRTPPSVFENAGANGAWQVRVVPNMFPAFAVPDVNLPAADFGKLSPGNAASPGAERAVGVHEVIIETARHVDRTSALSVSELRDVLEVYAERLRHWCADGRFRYGLVFKNQGPRAGASLTHLHSQFVAMPAVPSNVGREMHRAENEFGREKACPYCRLLQHERAAGARIVLDRDGYVAYCPYASWQPWEVWLLPGQHQPSFERPHSPAAFDRLADVLHELIGRVEAIVPDASYNLLLRTAPWIEGVDGWCHWRIELLPRVASFAGLELAAGIHINPLSPEHAAQQLRK